MCENATIYNINRMKRLIYISRADLSRPGEAATLHSREDAKGLRGHGWDAILVACSSGPYNTPEGIKEISIVDMNHWFERVGFELNAILYFLRTDRPGFVMFRGPTNLGMIASVLTLLKIPYGVELNGISTYHVKEKYKYRAWIDKLLETYILKRARLIVGVTEELSNYAREQFPACRKIATARNGVSLNDIRPVKFKQSEYEIKIGFLGKAYEARGLDKAIGVVAELRNRAINAGMVVVGGGPQIPQLKDLSNKYKVSEHIIFRDEVPPAAMADEIADCHVMWASYDDNYQLRQSGLSPLKLWTYLALAKPVFVRDPGALSYYRNVSGLFWAEGNDVISLTNELLSYWDKHGMQGFCEHGILGRKYVEENVSWCKHTEIISQAISEVIESDN